MVKHERLLEYLISFKDSHNEELFELIINEFKNLIKKTDNIVVDKNGSTVEKTIYPDINKNLFIDCVSVRSCDRIHNSKPVYCLTRRKNTYDENNTVIYSIADMQNVDFNSTNYENYQSLIY